MNDRVLIPFCLLAGVLVINGTRGIGWIAHFVVPGLVLGLVFWAVIRAVMWLRP